MQIVVIPIDNLTPYEKNAKIHTPEQIKQIKTSIKKFGMNDPIGIWGDKNIIIEGHGRWLALKELGYTEVDCIRLDHLTDKERKAYGLAHNKLTMNTDFDFNILSEELNALDDFDMSEFGFEINNVDFTDEFNDEFEYESDNLGQRGEANTVVRVGEYRFSLTRDEYLSLLEDVQLKAGFTNDEIINELKSRLLKCNW